jgi:hypothetical protein
MVTENFMLELLAVSTRSFERQYPTAVGIQQEPDLDLSMVPDGLWSAVPLAPPFQGGGKPPHSEDLDPWTYPFLGLYDDQ